MTHAEFLCCLLESEVNTRDEKDLLKRLKAANLPRKHDLSEFDFKFSHSLSESRLRELRELTWMEQAFNIILMGPSGTGKTFIAAGLVHDAVRQGFRASLMTMEDLVSTLRLKDLTPTYLAAYNRLLRLHLLAIDDIMMFPMKKEEATAFFNLINTLHEKTSIIITTNKSPTEWAERLDDEVLAAAILDRLMFKCQVVKLSGESYRMSNRQSIFKD
jgi:DNA replication protein DnaC